MAELVFFLEEASAEHLIRELLPRLSSRPNVRTRFFRYDGKQDLQRNIGKDLRRISSHSCCILLQDQDMQDCLVLKAKLAKLCAERKEGVTIRIACRELESWYLAQLDAVEKAFGLKGLSKQQRKAKFRNPDSLPHPDLLLGDLLAPYKRSYAKLRDSRLIGRVLDPADTRSPSFSHFIRAVRTALESVESQPPAVSPT